MDSILEPELDYDVVIIGAGLSGIYSVLRMTQMGLRARVLEAASGEGGTWFWNRYPGCRFDSESYTYGFTFSQEVLEEWSWTEHFAPQAETLKYAQYLTDKFDLRQYMQFNTRVKSAHFQEDTHSWLIRDATGRPYSCRFLITAMGILNEPTIPKILGMEDFQGQAFHTARWPEGWDFDGKKVGIIGTGATAIQIIPELVKTDLASLTVFQRRPNWSAPLRNDRISPEEMNDLRRRYPEIIKACERSGSGFMHSLDPRKTFEVPKAERLAFWEKLYIQRGSAKWIGAFADHLWDKEANEAFSKFHAEKIRQRLKDPVVADKLIPKCHGYGTRRVPFETDYFEAYNQPNVRLVDYSADSPIERITEHGVRLASGEALQLDVLIYATGFDGITGALTNGIDLRGLDNISPSKLWQNGIKTYFGLFLPSFPNLGMILAPHTAFGNIPRSIQFAVDSMARLVTHCQKNRFTYFEPSQEGVEAWTEHVHDCARGMLGQEVDSWLTNVNRNVTGKQKRVVARYYGSGPEFRRRVNEEADGGWKQMVFKTSAFKEQRRRTDRPAL